MGISGCVAGGGVAGEGAVGGDGDAAAAAVDVAPLMGATEAGCEEGAGVPPEGSAPPAESSKSLFRDRSCAIWRL